MELTGYDTVLFTCGDPRPVLLKALKSLSQRWPDLCCVVSRIRQMGNKDFFPGVLPQFDDLHQDDCEVLVAKDAAMNAHWETKGQVPMPDGDGPVMLLYRRRGPIIFQLKRVTEVEREKDQVGIIDPYEAWLSSQRLFEITVVTPGSPSKHPFSEWIWNHVLRATVDQSANPLV